MAKVEIGLPQIGAAAHVTEREATARPRGVGFTGVLAWAMARHRRLVLALWVALMAAGFPFALQLEGRLTSAGWDVAGSESLAARQLLEREFAFAYPQNLIVVFHHPALRAEDAAYRAQVDAAVAALRGQPHVGDVYTYYGTGNPRLASADRHTTWAFVGLSATADEATVAAPDLVARVRAARRDGFAVDVTGQPAMWADFNRTNKQAMLDGERYARPAVLLILLVAFGSAVAAGIPMFLTMVALGVTMGVLYLISFLMPLSIWVMNFVAMVGFGVGIDYCLFIVSRFRDELRRQPSVPAAVAVPVGDFRRLGLRSVNDDVRLALRRDADQQQLVDLAREGTPNELSLTVGGEDNLATLHRHPAPRVSADVSPANGREWLWARGVGPRRASDFARHVTSYIGGRLMGRGPWPYHPDGHCTPVVDRCSRSRGYVRRTPGWRHSTVADSAVRARLDRGSSPRR